MFLFAVAAIATSAIAEPISITKGQAGGVPPAPPTSIKFDLLQSTSSASVGLEIDNVTLADNGRVWTIRQSNAADYGLDWLTFQSAWNDPIWDRVRTRFGPIALSDAKTSDPTHRPKNFVVDRVEVDLAAYVRLSQSIGQYEVDITTIGEGQIVPEPRSYAIALTGFGFLTLFHITARRLRGSAYW
jgi:hypothetical protein